MEAPTSTCDLSTLKGKGCHHPCEGYSALYGPSSTTAEILVGLYILDEPHLFLKPSYFPLTLHRHIGKVSKYPLTTFVSGWVSKVSRQGMYYCLMK
jgi:hypothetical protein